MKNLTIVPQQTWLPTSVHGTHVVMRGDAIAYGPGTLAECEDYVMAWTEGPFTKESAATREP